MGINAELSDLQAATALAGGELIYIVQGGNSRKATLGAVGAQLLEDTGQTAARTTLGIAAIVANTMPVDNAAGTAREQKTFAEVRTSLNVPHLGDTGTQTFTGPIAAPYILPTYRGLKISEFLTVDAAFTDQSAQVQDAVDAWQSNARYASLDFEGRLITLSTPINIDNAPNSPSLTNKPKTMMNGNFFTPSGFNGGVSTGLTSYAFRLFDSDATRLQHVYFKNININANKNAGIGFYIDGDMDTIGFSDCTLLDFNTSFFKNNHADSINAMFLRCIAERTDASTAFASRTAIGYDLVGADTKMAQCWAKYCKNGLLYDGHSLQITNSHIYQGLASGTGITGHNPAVIIESQPDLKMSNCYIDNGYLLVDGSLQTAGSHGRIDITDTIFTLASGTSAYNFIVDKPTNANTKLFDWSIRGCTFRSFGGVTVTSPFAVDTSLGGTVKTDNAERMFIRDNIWNSVTEQSTQYTVKFTMDGSTSYAYDITGASPFALQFNSGRVGGVMRAGATPYYSVIERSTAYTGNLVFNAAVASGNCLVEFDANATFNSP